MWFKQKKEINWNKNDLSSHGIVSEPLESNLNAKDCGYLGEVGEVGEVLYTEPTDVSIVKVPVSPGYYFSDPIKPLDSGFNTETIVS